jgi:uncharacterized protein YciI
MTARVDASIIATARVLGRCVIAAALGALAGCAAPSRSGGAAPGAATQTGEFVYVKLLTGPRSAEHSPERRSEIMRGHMANMNRLADEGHLLIAGPFAKPRNAAWRGLLVLNTASLDQAREWVATDPGVAEGVFTPELTPMRSAAAIRRALEVEREMLAAQTGIPASPSGQPPATMRRYVIVTASDWSAMRRALGTATIGGSPLARKVVWWGEFSGEARGRGVVVFDAEDPTAIDELLSAADAGAFSADGWFSTVSLMRLGGGAGL